MICINCDRKSNTVFYSEVYPCLTCGDETVVEYNACKYCGVVWKTANGAPMDSLKTKIGDFSDMFKDNESFEDFFNLVGQNKEVSSMNQCIHRCLMCNAVSYEVEDGLYECPECNFEWEVA